MLRSSLASLGEGVCVFSTVHSHGVTEGHRTPCPFWRFGEVYA